MSTQGQQDAAAMVREALLFLNTALELCCQEQVQVELEVREYGGGMPQSLLVEARFEALEEL